MPPGPRASFSMCVHKKRALLFGGVVDMEMEDDVLLSLFLNELYGFQLDTHRWYPLELRKEKSTKIKKNTNEERNCLSLNSDISPTELVTSVANEIDEKMDCDEEMDLESNIVAISSTMERSVTVDYSDKASSDVKPRDSCSKLVTQNCLSAEIVKPCGRINSSMAVAKDVLYIYGGMTENRDQEITLDDLYALNLSKLDEWKCLIPASKSEWIEASEEEDEEEDDDEDDGEDDEEDTDDDTDETDDDDGNNDVEGRNGSVIGDAVAVIRGEGKKLRRKEKRSRIEQIRASLGLSDSQRTPSPGESLRDFYKRTCPYWQMAAYEHTEHTGKELRKDGFDLAEARYKELKPILDELAILEAEQKAEEEEAPETSSSKKRGNKKNKHLTPR